MYSGVLSPVSLRIVRLISSAMAPCNPLTLKGHQRYHAIVCESRPLYFRRIHWGIERRDGRSTRMNESPVEVAEVSWWATLSTPRPCRSVSSYRKREVHSNKVLRSIKMPKSKCDSSKWDRKASMNVCEIFGSAMDQASICIHAGCNKRSLLFSVVNR